MDTYLIGLSKSFPMNTNMAGFKSFSKLFAFLCLNLIKVASALKGLTLLHQECTVQASSAH